MKRRRLESNDTHGSAMGFSLCSSITFRVYVCRLVTYHGRERAIDGVDFLTIIRDRISTES